MLDRIPYLIAVFGMTLGVFIAILFGINEDIFKGKIEKGLEQNQKIQQIEDPDERQAKIKAEASKNWRYYQRFHFHSTGIGAMSLGLLILLAFLGGPAKLRLGTAYATAIGGFLYPFVWLFAGIYGPEMGRHEAKEAFAIFGYMGGVFFLATLVVLYLGIRYPMRLKLSKDF